MALWLVKSQVLFSGMKLDSSGLGTTRLIIKLDPSPKID